MKVRCFIALISCFLVMPFAEGAYLATVQAESAHYQAVVDSSYNGAEGAQVDQIKFYKTVGQALAEAPADSTSPYVIYIKNGRYYEKLRVDKPFITLLGEDKEKTFLTYDAASSTLSPSGKKYGTSGSGSIIVRAENFRAENLTIENGFDYLANQSKDQDDPTKVKDTQAVALKLEFKSDKAVFSNIKLLGFQDTLYVDAGRSYFTDCYIAGNVDFIFGAGQAVFNHCDIVSRLGGYVTAPSTKGDKPYGILIMNSRLQRESSQVLDDSVQLRRPWHPGGNPAVNSEAVYLNCFMDSHISFRGWDSMSGIRPEDSRFYEYDSTGPGAKTSSTRQLMSSDRAADFTIEHVLDGWNPEQN